MFNFKLKKKNSISSMANDAFRSSIGLPPEEKGFFGTRGDNAIKLWKTPWDNKSILGNKSVFDKAVAAQTSKEKKLQSDEFIKNKKALGLLGLFTSGKQRVERDEASYIDGITEKQYVSPMVRGLFKTSAKLGGNNSLTGA